MRSILLALFTLALICSPSPAQSHDKLAPYPALRWQDDKPEVRHDGTWFRLSAIDGTAVDDILVFCRQRYDDRWQKRFGEDLVEVLSEMGKPPGRTVDLTLVDLESGEVEVAEGIAMTPENRQAIRTGGGGRSGQPRFDPRAPFPKLSPFTAMRDGGEQVEVRIAGGAHWYAWLKIDDVATDDVVAWCKGEFGNRWWVRITEDLVQVLASMGHRPGTGVALALRDIDSGDVVVREGVPMTAANRDRIRDANAEREAAPVGSTGDRRLTPEQWGADLDRLGDAIAERFSYAELRVGKPGDLLAELRAQLDARETVTVADLALALTEALARFGDGHAGVRETRSLLPVGYLPFLVAEVGGGRIVAFSPDRSRFAAEGHPYLVAIDGQPVGDWIDTAARLVAAGSPQLVRTRALRDLRFLAALRVLRGAEPTGTLTAVFAAEDGAEKAVELPVSDRYPTYGPWPRPSAHRLGGDGRLGYLRIPAMDDDPAFLGGLDAAMERFRDTDGLIIDVRGNAGGSRAALRRLFSYFMTDERGVRVANVAAYRLARGDDPSDPGGFLRDRELYPAGWDGWSPAARAAIDELARRFRPEWPLPRGKFSDWHYYVLERGDNRRAYAYEKPVVILSDPVCFSATDVFLGALEGWPGVTIMGAPSAGGSGRGQTHDLAESGLRVRLSTMASFRPDGRLYDGRGIEVDVLVEPVATDLLGATDSVLEAAVERLTGDRRRR